MQLGEADEQDAAIGTTKDVFDELFSHQQLLQLYGSISEVSLLIGGRSPVCWWPPDNVETLPSTGSSSTSLTSPLGTTTPSRLSAGGMAMDVDVPPRSVTASPMSQPASASAAAALAAVGSVAPGSTSNPSSARMLVQLEEEVDLVAIKFQGAQVGVTMGGDGLVTEVAMTALTMDDLLVGARNPDKAHMARSSIDWETQQKQHQQKQQGNLATAADIVTPGEGCHAG